MARKGRGRLRELGELVAQAYPDLADPHDLIRGGAVSCDGRVLTNPASLVPDEASITIRIKAPLRGEAKLRAALDAFEVRVAGRIALDLGAAAGGFTRVLLEAGAQRVYAVDVGHGQLLGSLRQDPRVVNLERTNLADLSADVVSEQVEIVTLDLSYVSLADAVPELEGKVVFAARADLVALVKPQFELGLAAPPRVVEADAAVRAAARGIERAPWRVLATVHSPVRGGRGSVEFLLHARRRGPSPRLKSGDSERAC